MGANQLENRSALSGRWVTDYSDRKNPLPKYPERTRRNLVPAEGFEPPTPGLQITSNATEVADDGGGHAGTAIR